MAVGNPGHHVASADREDDIARLVSSLVSIGFFGIVLLVERCVVRWREETRVDL
jgi:hypothetical protein